MQNRKKYLKGGYGRKTIKTLLKKHFETDKMSL